MPVLDIVYKIIKKVKTVHTAMTIGYSRRCCSHQTECRTWHFDLYQFTGDNSFIG